MVWKIIINCQVLLNFSGFRQKKIELWAFHLFSCNTDNDFSRGFSKTNNTFISLNAVYMKKKKMSPHAVLCHFVFWGGNTSYRQICNFFNQAKPLTFDPWVEVSLHLSTEKSPQHPLMKILHYWKKCLQQPENTSRVSICQWI